MTVYYALILSVVVFYFARTALVEWGASMALVDKTFNALIAVMTLLLFSLRSTSVGGDVGQYVALFRSGDALGHRKMEVEVGYAWLSDTIHAFTTDANLFLAIMSLFMIIPVAWVFHTSSVNIYLSWLMFITIGPFALMLSGLRQGIALALVFASFPFLINKSVIVPIILTGLAATFHVSALLFVPAVFLYRARLTVGFALATVGTSTLIFLLGDTLLGFVISNLYGSYEVIATGAYRWAALNAVLWAVLATRYRTVYQRFSGFSGLYILTLLGIVLLAFTALSTNAVRGGAYYYQFMILLIPTALQTIRDGRGRILVGGGLSLLAIAYFFTRVVFSQYAISPYSFYWQ